MDESEPMYVFENINDILIFAQWVHENFESPEEYEGWFEHSLDSAVPSEVFCTRPQKKVEKMHVCVECKAQFTTKSGLSVHQNVVHTRKLNNAEFWDIIKTTYNDHNEDHNEPNISDTD
jgi:hypothetical protein